MYMQVRLRPRVCCSCCLKLKMVRPLGAVGPTKCCTRLGCPLIRLVVFLLRWNPRLSCSVWIFSTYPDTHSAMGHGYLAAGAVSKPDSTTVAGATYFLAQSVILQGGLLWRWILFQLSLFAFTVDESSVHPISREILCTACSWDNSSSWLEAWKTALWQLSTLVVFEWHSGFPLHEIEKRHKLFCRTTFACWVPASPSCTSKSNECHKSLWGVVYQESGHWHWTAANNQCERRQYRVFLCSFQGDKRNQCG